MHGCPYHAPRRSGSGLFWLAAAVAGLLLVAPHAKELRGHVPAGLRFSSLAPQGIPRLPDLSGNRRITTTTGHGCDPARDLRTGTPLDRRVRELLAAASTRWPVRVSCVHAGHSRYVKGTRRVSNHTVWRAVDLDMVSGRPVSRDNRDAKALARWLGGLAGPLRPSEVGSPWASGGRPWFSDEGHQDHVHIGYGAR